MLSCLGFWACASPIYAKCNLTNLTLIQRARVACNYIGLPAQILLRILEDKSRSDLIGYVTDHKSAQIQIQLTTDPLSVDQHRSGISNLKDNNKLQ